MPDEPSSAAEAGRLREENRRLRTQLIELEFLAGMAERLEEHTSLEDLQREILNRIADRLDAEVASLMLLDSGSNELQVRASRGLSDEVIREARVKIGQSISGRVAASGRSLLVGNVEELFGRPNRVGYRTLGCMSAPVRFRGQMLGVINFADKRSGEFSDADLELASRLGRQAAGLLVTAMGHQALIQQERYERELQFAHTLQESFLPGRPPQVPGLLLSARYVPALEVGGDLYDFIPLPDGRLGVLIGDVSGKGIPAALFMARFSSDFRGLAMSGLPPAEAMTRVNRMVAERSRRGLFVTATYLVVDPASGEVRISNAGHPVPAICSGEGHPVRAIGDAIDIPLGIVPDTSYPEGQFRLEDGQSVVLLTDGAFDAKNSSGDRFGLDRLSVCLAGGAARPRETIERLVSSIYRFVGSDAQVDDLTIVAVGKFPTTD